MLRRSANGNVLQVPKLRVRLELGVPLQIEDSLILEPVQRRALGNVSKGGDGVNPTHNLWCPSKAPSLYRDSENTS
eukprot:5633481-Pyramimonas_sp.AAC.1